ncbi:hypothetical protein [Deinococcus roseus]|uniref:DUF11 domain-containing protein n=1 Tax=Deinococcus roseus TaxID=392414 RepID=A0ABQ2CZ56_9DEIO|nr:hypothetical protein [Deinococcus roseus]GGJ35179.1 hypothetical protein GCM10008938_21580 [Deinococcus roseus]
MKHSRTHLILLLMGGFSFAQQSQAPKLELKNQVFTVVKSQKDGQTVETLKASSGLQTPGQVGLLRLTLKNVSKEALKNIRPTQPLNSAQEYLAGSASSTRAVEFSFDGGKTYAPEPLFKNVSVQENGKTVLKKVQVKPSEYTDVRWTIPELQPGQTEVLDLRYTVR